MKTTFIKMLIGRLVRLQKRGMIVYINSTATDTAYSSMQGINVISISARQDLYGTIRIKGREIEFSHSWFDPLKISPKPTETENKMGLRLRRTFLRVVPPDLEEKISHLLRDSTMEKNRAQLSQEILKRPWSCPSIESSELLSPNWKAALQGSLKCKGGMEEKWWDLIKNFPLLSHSPLPFTQLLPHKRFLEENLLKNGTWSLGFAFP